MYYKQNTKYYFLLLLSFLLGCKHDPPGTYAGEHDDVFTNNFKRTNGWIAGDGATSIPLSSGQSLWLFGDSHINDFDAVSQTVPCLFQVHNAGLLMGITNPANPTTLTGSGNPASYFAVGSDNNYWFWPEAGFENGDTVYVFLSRIHSTGTGDWSFAKVDTNYVAKIANHNFSQISYCILPSSSGITFGSSVLKDSGYCYVYGVKSNGLGNDVFVARFPQDSIYSPWQYYTGSGWTGNVNLAQKIYSDFTASFSLCKINQKYVLITTEFSVDCNQGKNVYAAVSDNPYGPFINHHSVWVVDDLLYGYYPEFYLANAHPEYNNGLNQLLITYCINGYGSCINTCINNRMDPNFYRPKAIRVPFHSIDASL